VTAAKMQRLGIQTGADLRAKSLSFLQQHFGKSATWYLGIANGEDERLVVADRPRKSSGSETTFERDLTSPAEIEAGAEAMADEVWAWCEKASAFGRTITVKVKFADFQQITRSRSFPAPIARHDPLRQLSVDLVRTVLPMPKGVRLIGVTVSNFDKRPFATVAELPLFPSEDSSSWDNDE
jgi:DNA polymerase-4